MPPELVKVSVADVRVAVPAGAGVEAGLVVLREDEVPHRLLHIVIGQPEARGILAAWGGQAPARPSSWDLLVNAVGLLDARVDRAVIDGVQEGRYFFARLELERGDDRQVLVARPSDAVAIALRVPGAPLYAEMAVLDEAGRPPGGLSW